MAINSLNAASKGMSGLVSGMDTQSIVDSLLANTQGKITKANQQKSVLEMKQQLYRDVGADLRKLQSKYLDILSPTNLRSSSFYNKKNAAVTTPNEKNPAFSVTAGGGANAGNYSVEYISQLATAYTLKTKDPASGGISLGLDKDVAKQLIKQYEGANASLNITVGSSSFTIDEFVSKAEGKSTLEVADILNKAFQDEGVGATARIVNNELQIVADNADDFITITGSKDLSMQLFGGYDVVSGKGSISQSIDPSAYSPKLSITLDGRQRDIALSLTDLRAYTSSGGTEDDLLLGAVGSDGQRTGGLSAQLRQAFGTGVKLNGLALEAGSISQTFTVSGNIYVMDTLGLKSGMSNKVSTGLALKDQNFATALEGNYHSFTINGVGFSFTADRTLQSIMSEINSSKAGVNISYSSAEDRFIIKNTQTGAGLDSITFDQTEGNFLTSLFGVQGGANAAGGTIQKTMNGGVVTDADVAKGGKFTFNVNGTDYTFDIAAPGDSDPDYTLDTFTKKLNEAFAEKFGRKTDGSQNIEFSLTTDSGGNKHFQIEARNDAYVKTTGILGFGANETTRADRGDMTLSEAGIVSGSGNTIEINYGGSTASIALTGSKTMDDIAAELTTALGGGASVVFDKTSQSFRVLNTDKPLTLQVQGSDPGLEKLFGQTTLNVNQAGKAPADAYTEELGKNAIMSINGAEIERSTNSFTYEGMTITLNSTMEASSTPSKITVTRDTDSIVKGIQEFLSAYNEMIDTISGLYKADPVYKDYPPLTDDQKSGMSDREIEKWEEKSQEGLLRSDQHLGRILTSLRSAMYTKPSGSSLAIYDLGISTSFYATEGHFVESTTGPSLKEMVEKDPDAVMKLFAGENGIMSLVNDAIDQAAKTSSGSPGYLTRTAGHNSYDTTSSIYKQIKSINSQLESLETRYWSEYDRYWAQFNQMEKYISQMNSQSSWLAQQ